ncbi:hypothetical protein [[Phormidium] sp. ETS-05]|uniref:hypothetical protein n=1 Tax=[Phormidium] sp. ETS-05 TaxID=222819 RepID=UPI0018EED841|nr:hypothetical protein [[Phormidium] sp. ETS-05]
MAKSIFELVDQLPADNMTVKTLRALDFVVPGQWENIIGFDNTIRIVTGFDDEDLIQQVGERAIALYNDKSQGYQRAMWLYQTVDSFDSALGAAALANKVGDSIPLLGFLNRVTPKPDKAQTIDLAIKVVVELLAFCQINGIPGDSIGDFVGSLADYGGESLMRLAALVCIDGLLPLGPDFLQKVLDTINNLSTGELEANPVFGGISSMIPGGNTGSKLGFIGEAVGSVSGWMGDFVADRGLSPELIMNNLKGFLDFSDDKLDYVAAFLDMTTNYYEHTGTQTLARRLLERAMAEI